MAHIIAQDCGKNLQSMQYKGRVEEAGLWRVTIFFLKVHELDLNHKRFGNTELQHSKHFKSSSLRMKSKSFCLPLTRADAKTTQS